ncbi:hypothetical protein B0H13DRAFT_2666902 [Mycena leptocephala]|nr:hypothetical protein B0H13DRAFT_2666902 [Mycena leptocephala]
MLFHDLPEDVLFEILTYCDVYTVVSFLRVCEFSRVAALSKPLWRSLLRGLSARHHILNLHAIDGYTTEQLIAEAKHLVCGPATWSDKSSVPPTVSSSKSFPLNTQTRLLPGGRYFSVMQHDEMQVFDAVTGRRVWLRSLAGTHARAWEVEMRDDGQSAVFFFVHNNSATNRQVLSIVQADFSTGLWDVHFDGVLNNYIGRACNPVLSGDLLGVKWVYRPYGKRERGMLVIDWRKQLYVIFDCTTVSLTQAFVPGNIIFTTATAQQPNDRLLLIYTLASIGSHWRPIGQLLSMLQPLPPSWSGWKTPIFACRDVQSRVFNHHMHMTLHPNPIRDNAYKLMIYTSNRKWGNKSGFADTLRQKLGRQPPGAKAVLFTYRLIVGSPPDYSLSWTRVSVVPAVPQIIPPISYAGYAVAAPKTLDGLGQASDTRSSGVTETVEPCGMDGSHFPPYLWDGSCETQRRPLPLPLVNAASVAGRLSSFEFPADYDPSAIPSMDPTGFFAHPLPPDLFPFHPEFPASASWDGTLASSWLPASTQQPNEWDDRSIQPLWDDLVSSFQPAAVRPPSTGSSAGDLFDDLPLSSLTSAVDVASDIAGTRRASTRKRTQAESATAASSSSTSSSKRRKKLEDPLAGWVMQDPDTGEELTRKEWVERYPEDFKMCYKKDHQRYLDYLAQSVSDS